MRKPSHDTDYADRVAAYQAHLRNWRAWPKEELAAYIKATGDHPRYLDELRLREYFGYALMAAVVVVANCYGFVRRVWKRS
jgi:hypothetical protein